MLPGERSDNQESAYEQERAKYTVAFFGTGSEKTLSDKTAMQIAERLGQSMAREGHPIITGGFNSGVMEAASRGADITAQELGRDDLKPKGIAVGKESLTKNTKHAEVIDKETLSERIADLIKENQASVVLSGGGGTINELISALSDKAVNELLVAKGVAKLPEKPIVIVDPSGKHMDLMRFLSKQDPKMLHWFEHMYHVGVYDENIDEAVQEVSRIIEDYFQKSLENEVSEDEKTWLDNHSVRGFLKKGEEFEQGEGI